MDKSAVQDPARIKSHVGKVEYRVGSRDVSPGGSMALATVSMCSTVEGLSQVITMLRIP